MITLTCIVPFLQTLTSAPAVLTTATVHLLHVQTQWDPLVVHVAVLTSEMAKLALIFHTVIIITKNQECVYSLDPYLHSLEACCFNLDCLKRVSVKCKYYPDLLSTNRKARSGQLIKFNSLFYQPFNLPKKYMYCGNDMSIVISAHYGVCNSFFTKSFSTLFPFCPPPLYYDERIHVSIMAGFAQAKAH